MAESLRFSPLGIRRYLRPSRWSRAETIRFAAFPSPYGFDAAGHGGMGGRVAQEPAGLADDPCPARADQSHHARLDALGPLRRIAHDQHRHAQTRRLFLDAAGIRQDQRRTLHQLHEREVIQRLDQAQVASGPIGSRRPAGGRSGSDARGRRSGRRLPQTPGPALESPGTSRETAGRNSPAGGR